MKNILSLFALLFLINSYNQVDVSPSKLYKYIEATGGKRKLESVESIMMVEILKFLKHHLSHPL